MGNPFYNQNQPTQNPNPMMNMVQQFKANFRGDPRQRVQELLNSGQMSQQQFNYLSNLAHQVAQTAQLEAFIRANQTTPATTAG